MAFMDSFMEIYMAIMEIFSIFRVLFEVLMELINLIIVPFLRLLLYVFKLLMQVISKLAGNIRYFSILILKLVNYLKDILIFIPRSILVITRTFKSWFDKFIYYFKVAIGLLGYVIGYPSTLYDGDNFF
jgi:hypothetical protein